VEVHEDRATVEGPAEEDVHLCQLIRPGHGPHHETGDPDGRKDAAAGEERDATLGPLLAA
jgi:hypothetical protein